MYTHLKELRESLGMTQEEFGKSIGVAKSTYNNYETGIRDPKSDFWVAVATKYGVTIEYLMGHSDDPHSVGSCVKKDPPISYKAMKLARDYESLDQQGKDAARAAVDSELDRIKNARNVALNFGDKLRMCRELARLTINQLADATEISEKSIKHYESGHPYISFPTEGDLQKLASFFQVEPENLLGPVTKIDKQAYEYGVSVLVSDCYSGINANLTSLNPAGIKMFANYVKDVAEELPTGEKILIKDSELQDEWMSDIDFTIYRAIGEEARTITELLFNFDVVGLSDVCRYTFELAFKPEYQGSKVPDRA